MASPDLTPYVDLRLYDKDPQEIFEAAILDMQYKVPEWVPREANTEVVLLESMALEVAESVFALNRLPGAIVEVLMRMYGIERYVGDTPTATIEFTVSTTAGIELPPGIRVRLVLGDGLEPVIFTTTQAVLIPAGVTTGTATADGDRYSADANDTPAGTVLEIMDSIVYLERAKLATAVTDGADAESDEEWRNRAVARFGRLTETLVLPNHFTQAALERPELVRATTIDNYAPGQLTPPAATATVSATGGTLGAGTYTYILTTRNQYGETEGSTAVTATVASGTTNSIVLDWPDVVPSDGAAAVTSYRVYGRTGGAEGLLATITNGSTYTDDGSATATDAPPTANTTGSAVGDSPGHVTVAVLGLNNALLSDVDKDAVRDDLDSQAQANLAVYVTDPTITAVDVTATIRHESGYTPAAVQASVTAALESYLDPAVWPWTATVRRNELIALISNVEGVAYVDTLTVPAADVTLPGVAPLADAGTITLTVVAV